MKKLIRRNKLFVSILAILVGCFVLNNKSDSYLRERVVKLVSPKGSCSGEQIIAPSGENYILTAAHCLVLKDANNSIEVITESGEHLSRRVIAEDHASDLLLLEGLPNLKGLSIASSSRNKEEVRTFTHGRGFDTYQTKGVLIQDSRAQMLTEDYNCSLNYSKYKIVEIDLGFFPIKVCIIDVIEKATTALIVPGSSGGMVVNSYGNLVGVVSAGDGTFGYLVTLSDIQSFLSGY